MNIYEFPPGRRIFAAGEIERRATARNLPAIAAHCTRVIAHDREILRIFLRRDAGGGGQYGSDAPAIDNLVDHALVGFHAHLDAQSRMFLGEPRGTSAATVRQALFPNGPGAITQLPYAQQHAQTDAMLAHLEEPSLVEHVNALSDLPPLIERIRTLNAQYGQALHAYGRIPSPDELRALRARGQELMAEVVAMILAHFATLDPPDPEGRAHMLAPVVHQNEAIRSSRRRRRRPQDIDPDTGEELPTEPGDEDPGDPSGELPGEPGGEDPGEPGDEDPGEPGALSA